jgi:hypothetical protein
MDKPFSEACERNKAPILQCLQPLYAPLRSVFEVGSGTGQHAQHFAAAMPHLRWQCSETPAQLDLLQRGLAGHGLANLPPPLRFAAGQPWPAEPADAVFSANTLHIMGWDEVQQLFAGLAGWLPAQGLLTVYGPFNYGGRFTSDGNARFDASLRAADPRRGLRDFEAVDALAQAAGLQLLEDRAMPANNRCITWRRGAAEALR